MIFDLCHIFVSTRGFQGYRIPARTLINGDLYRVHANDPLFDNPSEFRPERYLNEDGKTINKVRFFVTKSILYSPTVPSIYPYRTPLIVRFPSLWARDSVRERDWHESNCCWVCHRQFKSTVSCLRRKDRWISRRTIILSFCPNSSHWDWRSCEAKVIVQLLIYYFLNKIFANFQNNAHIS